MPLEASDLGMFEHTSAPKRILIVQSAAQLARPDIDIEQLRGRATCICSALWRKCDKILMKAEAIC